MTGYTHSYTQTHTHMHTHTCTHAHTCTRTRTRTHKNAHKTYTHAQHTCVHTCATYMRICTCIPIPANHTHMRRYIHTCIHTHMHTYVHTNIHARYDKSNGTNDMHDYCKQLLAIDFTHAKHCKHTHSSCSEQRYLYVHTMFT